MDAKQIREFLEMAKKLPRCMITAYDGKVDILVHDKEMFEKLVGPNDFEIDEYEGKYQLIYVDNGIKYTSWEE